MLYFGAGLGDNWGIQIRLSTSSLAKITPASQDNLLHARIADSSSISAVSFSSPSTTKRFPSLQRVSNPDRERAALVIVQNRLPCGFAHFKLCAHFLQARVSASICFCCFAAFGSHCCFHAHELRKRLACLSRQLSRNPPLKGQKDAQLLIRTHSEMLPIVAVSISNPDCSPARKK